MFSNLDKIRLRWRFDFQNRPAKYGQWSMPASRLEDMAAMNNGSGLVLASIEAQDVITQDVFTVASCAGWDFINFEWKCAAYGMDGGYQEIIGLTLVTRERQCHVYTSGETKLELRSDFDKQFNYATFGK